MASSSSASSSHENFRLQPEDWSDSYENEPLVKKKRLSLKKKGSEPPSKENEPPVKQKRLSLKKGSEGRLTYLSPEEESALSDKCSEKYSD